MLVGSRLPVWTALLAVRMSSDLPAHLQGLDDDDVIIGDIVPGADYSDDDSDEPLIGSSAPTVWPLGEQPDPSLRFASWFAEDEQRGDRIVYGPSVEELRARRHAEQLQRLDAVRAVLHERGLGRRQVSTCLRRAPRLGLLDAGTLRDRLAVLEAAFSADALRRVVIRAPSLLLHTALADSLRAKLDQLETLTGLDADRTAKLAATLLLLDAGAVQERARLLQNHLPELHVPGLLRRAPNLLSLRPSAVRASLDELVAMLPAEVDVAGLVQRQPTLLGMAPATLRPKIERLHALCDSTEWERLCHGPPGSLARVLTASLEVIERLADATNEARRPRPVVRMLLMSRAEYAQAREAGTTVGRPRGWVGSVQRRRASQAAAPELHS